MACARRAKLRTATAQRIFVLGAFAGPAHPLLNTVSATLRKDCCTAILRRRAMLVNFPCELEVTYASIKIVAAKVPADESKIR
jgi:hypothetical protein